MTATAERDAVVVPPGGSLRGTLAIPGDKSISHRSVMLGAIAEGTTRISNFLAGEDCLGSIRAMRALGVPIEGEGSDWIVTGRGLRGLADPEDVIDVGNSGTTIRLLLGLLAGSGVFATLTGDDSIRRRPMGRVVAPLRQIGAQVWGRKDGTLAPLAVKGTRLEAISYQSPVASAQVKSALLFAGLSAEGITSVTEPALSRDHSERMLRAMGARIRREGLTVSIEGGHRLQAVDVAVPGDISSAAFWLVAGAIAPGSELLLENVGVNPTRTGILDVLTLMGADLTRLNERSSAGEEVADLRIRSSRLRGVTIGGDLIPRLVDEIPILALAAACAEGPTVIQDAQELRVKESDRLRAIARELGALGARIAERPDGLVIEGGASWRGGTAASHGDHRMAMTLALAALVSPEPVTVQGTQCVQTSYPAFWTTLAGTRV